MNDPKVGSLVERANYWEEQAEGRLDQIAVLTKRVSELEAYALDWGSKDTNKILELAKQIDEIAAERNGLKQVLDDQHYYETDCSACADNMKAAHQAIQEKP